MKKTLLLLAAAFVAFGVTAQNKISIEDLEPFNNVQVTGKIELSVTIDSLLPLSMNIFMNGNDPNNLKWWETEEGVLQIKHPSRSKDLPVIIKLNCHELTDLELVGTSMVLESVWEANMVTITMSNNAKLTAEIYTKDLNISTQTGSAAVIKGGGYYADYNTRSKSILDARYYEAESAFLRAAGYSECYVYGVERLVMEVFEGSAVFYRGAPELFREQVRRGGHTNYIGD